MTNINNSYPVLPLRDIVVFPHMIVPLFVGREKSVKALEEVMQDDKDIVLASQIDPNEDDPSKDGIYNVGVIANVLQLLKLPDETLLYPAHDYKGEKVSTIGKEKKFNPRLQVNNVDEYVQIMNDLNLKKPAAIDFNVASNLKLGTI